MAPITKVTMPFQRFLHSEESGGIVLIVCTIIALVWANSGFSDSYVALWESHFTIGFDAFHLSKSLLHWINDGLMAVFFLFVGLEIKREILVGELASFRKAILPVAGAFGGMLVPATIYILFNSGGAGSAGWGIPMATDIAFALGILSLLGKRIPQGLTIFLAALAIADDLGAVAVIALFYTSQIAWVSLAVAGVAFLLLVLANLSGVSSPLVYLLLGLVVWIAVLISGIHASIAGVLVALTIPARMRITVGEFQEQSSLLLEEFDRVERSVDERERSDDQDAVIQAMEKVCERVQTPLGRMEHGLSRWVSFFIMPIFALANAGVVFSGDLLSIIGSPITVGVGLGLVIGKMIGITLFSWLAVRAGLASLPDGVGWRQIHGAAWLGGIGFTMSLFIAGLALTEPRLVMSAKIGILAASIIGGLVGWLILRRGPEPTPAGNGGL
ncbi:MAG: Na+/H+ antiporter NhaA [Bacteroidota bacterium]